ncbi:MAG: hypothetical protein O3A77_01650 [bacterium]|nr:hypothetical protein [bacterium]
MKIITPIVLVSSVKGEIFPTKRNSMPEKPESARFLGAVTYVSTVKTLGDVSSAKEKEKVCTYRDRKSGTTSRMDCQALERRFLQSPGTCVEVGTMTFFDDGQRFVVNPLKSLCNIEGDIQAYQSSVSPVTGQANRKNKGNNEETYKVNTEHGDKLEYRVNTRTNKFKKEEV